MGSKPDDFSRINDVPFTLPELSPTEFEEIIGNAISNPNLGAGIEVSGTSGGGKSNFAEWFGERCFIKRVPFLFIDPHGDSSRKLIRILQKKQSSIKDSVLYVELSSPSQLVGFNPLKHPDNEASLSEYEQRSAERISCEMTANVILAAVGEAGQGFGSRPVLRKWVMRWLTFLYRSNLTLADARMFLDPHDPIYQLILNLAPDELSHNQMAALANQKSSEIEAEIGSARNRLLTLLDHPASQIILSRRDKVLNFEEVYQNGQTVIINLECGKVLTEEVQRMLANLILTQYLRVVLSTPLALRKRRFCIIDELPVFSASCGPILDQMCRQIRKYLTSFVFLHQGSSGFPMRQDDPFLLTILDMCRIKMFFRHNVDAEFFGKQITLSLNSKPVVKYQQIGEQQFSDGHEIVELMDVSEGGTETGGTTYGTSSGKAITEGVSEAVKKASSRASTEPQKTTSTTEAANQAESNSTHSSRSSTRSVSFKQTLIPKTITKKVVQSTQFYSIDELDRHASQILKNLKTGECAIIIDGSGGPMVCQTPESRSPFVKSPRFAVEVIQAWLRKLHQHPAYASPQTMQKERDEFLDRLLLELEDINMKRIANSEQTRGLPGSKDSVRILIPKDKPEDLLL